MQRPIVGFHTDDEGHWVAELECGHARHVRHQPPWINRRWVTSQCGRRGMLGYRLWCKRCADGEASSGVPVALPADAPHWHTLNLGDALLATPDVAAIETQFCRAFRQAGEPEDMALFVRHVSAGQLHCDVILYFSPAAEDVARHAGAECCMPPDPRGLGLLQGGAGARELLSPPPAGDEP